MGWYLLNIFIVIVSWLLPVKYHKQNGNIENYNSETNIQHRKKRTCFIATINWIILSGLRSWDIGADTLTYKRIMFDKTLNRTWKSVLGDYILRYVGDVDVTEPTYTLIEKIFQIFSTNYQGFLVFIAIVFFVPLGLFIYKYSQNACMSYVLFSSLFYSFFAITGHRQTIATALVVLIGTELIKKRKLILFFLLVLVATTIHTSAICFFPFYWISQIKINKFTVAAYWGIILFSFVLRKDFFELMKSVVGYESFQQNKDARAGIFLFLLLTIAFIVSLFYKIILRKGNHMTNISINAVFLACIFSSLLLINQVGMRVVQYYSIFLLFLLPEIKNLFNNKRDSDLFIFISNIVLILLLIRNQPVYSFCFM